jgi:hypothetical protein
MTGLGDGVSEVLGRIRQEINQVRSPQLRPYPDSSTSTSVPLEFDEEDEHFLSHDTLDIPDCGFERHVEKWSRIGHFTFYCY